MTSTYNIYKVKPTKLDQLKEKLTSVGLVEQKTLQKDGYSKTFYFSEKVEGNEAVSYTHLTLPTNREV